MSFEKKGAFVKTKSQRLAHLLVESGALAARDVENGEEPFVYNSGSCGPLYLDIKGRVGFDRVFDAMTRALAEIIESRGVSFDAIAGLMTGGAIPAFRLKQILSSRQRRAIPFLYVRAEGDPVPQREAIVGMRGNPALSSHMRVLLVDEVVNAAGTTARGTLLLRHAGFRVSDVAAVAHYENSAGNERLKQIGLRIHAVFTVREIVDAALAEKMLTPRLAAQCHDFLANPIGWSQRHLPASSGNG
ncbi:MAG: hypothetical protein HY475_03350 [Candidatus Terrybacteria bacterium]|nr:hypothetical protein [Candidatus Terrybacteria bacterium]